MKSKITKEEFDALSPEFQAEYDEKFQLKVESTDGRVLEDTSGLRSALEATRAERKTLESQLTTFEGIDVEEYKELKTNKGKHTSTTEAQLKEVETKYKTELAGKDERIKSLHSNLHKTKVQDAARAALSKVGASTTLLLPHVVSQLSMIEANNEFQVRVMNADGSERITRKENASHPMDIEEFVLSFKENPEFAGAFPGNKNKGGGTTPPDGTGGSSTIDYDSDSLVNNAEAIASGTMTMKM
jgi:hypothetical protein